MFTFDEFTTVTLAHINMREEKHGEESVPAIDVRFVREHGNAQLELLHADLRGSLYSAEDDLVQGALEGVAQAQTVLRFPKMRPFKWDLELTGCTVEVDYGMGGLSNVLLAECKVNQFLVECKEGGTTSITFRVQTSYVPDGALDKLVSMLGHETAITLEAPEAPAQGDLDLSTKPRAAANDPVTPEQALAATINKS